MRTTHRIIEGSASRLDGFADESVALIVTSPPYPMIEMWDTSFVRQSKGVKKAWESRNWMAAFEAMHELLDGCWRECFRVLQPGGIMCVNVGDATRTVEGRFQLFPNHARIIQFCLQIGFQSLPHILWRKPTNAPNKFMGSGMLPPGAYVTLEHEYILVFRKGNKRIFKTPEEKERRRQSAFFWEERNVWFSDLWTLTGVRQELTNGNARTRSGAFPFEIPWRLIHMFSIQGDTVLDPFAGTGTTLLAAMAAGRSSIGVEIDPEMVETIRDRLEKAQPPKLRTWNIQRIHAHDLFAREALAKGKTLKYRNEHYGFPVMTRQEVALKLPFPGKIEPDGQGCWHGFCSWDLAGVAVGQGKQLPLLYPDF